MPRRILLVEDETSIRESVTELLSMEGYLVETSEDGIDALLILCADRRIDGLLLDMGLPGYDGAEMLRRLAEAGGHRPPTIVMSAFGRSEVTRRIGCEIPLIDKPFSVPTLLAIVRKYFGAP